MRKVYLQALHDPEKRVVQIACMELGFRGGASTVPALFSVLSHPDWNTRLLISRTLIKLKAADQRVVSTLETLSRDPEAIKYDAMTEDMERKSKAAGPPPAWEGKGMWSRMADIRQQAHQMAAQQPAPRAH